MKKKVSQLARPWPTVEFSFCALADKFYIETLFR